MERRGQLRLVLLVSVVAMLAGAVWSLYTGQMLIAAVFGFAAVFDLLFMFFATRSS